MIGVVRKSLIALTLLSVAACTEQSGTQGSAALNVQEVTVRSLSDAPMLQERNINIPVAEVRADFQRTLEAALAEGSRADGQPVSVEVGVSEVQLATMVERAVLGRSFAEGQVTVRAADGAVVSGPQVVRGYAQEIPLAGAVGIITTQNVKDDYRSTVDAFAGAVRKSVFGG